MSLTSYLTELFSYLVFIPASLLCYLPVRNQLRSDARKTAAFMGLILCVSIPLLALIDAAFSFGYNTIMGPAMLLLLIVYHKTLKLHFSQSLAVFVLICAFLSFLSNFANAFDAARHPTASIEDFSLEASIFQLALCILFAAAVFYPLAKYGSWLIDHLAIHKVWYIASAVSGVFLAFNMLIYPRKYETLHMNRVRQFFYIGLPLLLLLLFLLCWVFYSIVQGLVEMAETRERNRILEMEESLYRKQQSYMEESAKARHDFRHTIRTLNELLSEGNIDTAKSYLEEYRIAMPKNDVVRYCNHTALNALLNYYAEAAHQHSIRLRIVAQLPDILPISDIDLCNIVGNILDNAIAACCEVPEPERRIDLTLSCPNDVRFCIVAANSFNGKVKMDGKKYLSTHRGGSGIGLDSITSAAERYGGIASFRHEGDEFISGVVLPMGRE